MEFEITCPIDGPVTVSLEDVDTVVLREPHAAEITFVCPKCGEQITVSAMVPPFLVAAIRALAEDGEVPEDNPLRDMAQLIGEMRGQIKFEGLDGFEATLDADGVESAGTPEQSVVHIDEETTDAYVEYFRRQLEHVGDVDEMLAEIDSEK